MLHALHRTAARIIGAYVAIHIFNHQLAIQSVQAHVAFMDAFCKICRLPLVEVVLLGCAAFQIGSGLYFIKSRWGQRRGFFERVQALSGRCLAYFLLAHVGAVLFGRAVLNLETNFYYAAAGMHFAPFM